MTQSIRDKTGRKFSSSKDLSYFERVLECWALLSYYEGQRLVNQFEYKENSISNFILSMALDLFGMTRQAVAVKLHSPCSFSYFRMASGASCLFVEESGYVTR